MKTTTAGSRFPKLVEKATEAAAAEAAAAAAGGFNDVAPLVLSEREVKERKMERELQERIETVWKRLKMSQGEQMSAAAKFCTDPHNPAVKKVNNNRKNRGIFLLVSIKVDWYRHGGLRL